MSRETAEIAIGRMFESQGRLNRYLVLGFIRSQIEAQREISEIDKIMEIDETQSEASEIDKIMEIVDGLILNLGKYSFHDLFTALNEGDFGEERKAMFNTCLDLIGIRG